MIKTLRAREKSVRSDFTLKSMLQVSLLITAVLMTCVLLSGLCFHSDVFHELQAKTLNSGVSISI